MNIGGRIAPPRFLLFAAAMAAAVPLLAGPLGLGHALLAGFDLAAVIFLLAMAPLLRQGDAESMRRLARANDANRVLLLIITGAVMLVVLAAVALELGDKGAPKPPVVALVIGTLTLCWLFTNVIYALHYAHLFYLKEEHGGGDRGGVDVPETEEPDYWDFLYFSFTLGMTFQTSDVDITDRRIRKVAIFHCLAAFVFNLGVVAFTVNVLGGG